MPEEPMPEPTFKIAITVYQRPELTLRALLSVLHQSYPHWRCTLYSDGPAPRAQRLVEQFVAGLEADGDPRVAKIEDFREVDRPEGGRWGNQLRRRALLEAASDYCVILSHDCELFPDYLERHAAQLRNRPWPCLSVVDVHVWNDRVMGQPRQQLPGGPEYLGVWPRGDHLRATEFRIAEVDLTCMAFPVAASHALGCFAEEDQGRYAADYLAYQRCIQAMDVAWTRGACAAHF
jgi:hypothetical protein